MRYTPEDLRALFPYSTDEDIANTVTHGLGVIMSVVMLITLSWTAGRHGSAIDGFAFIFYGSSVFFMFLMSTIYHSASNDVVRDVFKRLDHGSIFITILGSYTPYVFSVIKTDFAYIVYWILVGVTALGVIFKGVFSDKFDLFSTFLFIAMGWAAIVLVPGMLKGMPIGSFFLFLSSGIVYTVGAMFYAFARFKYAHAVWHLFVLVGVFLMYLSVILYIL